MTPGLLTTPKIDGHGHLFDPARFPYAAGVAYRPAPTSPQPPASPKSCRRTAWPVPCCWGPDSGHGIDNRGMLGACRQGGG